MRSSRSPSRNNSQGGCHDPECYRTTQRTAKYLFDRRGHLVKRWVDEGSYDEIESEIRQVLAAADHGVRLPPASHEATVFARTGQPSYAGITAETYLGAERRQRGAAGRQAGGQCPWCRRRLRRSRSLRWAPDDSSRRRSGATTAHADLSDSDPGVRGTRSAICRPLNRAGGRWVSLPAQIAIKPLTRAMRQVEMTPCLHLIRFSTTTLSSMRILA